MYFFFRDSSETDNDANCISSDFSSELAREQFIENVHLTFNLEAGLLLPFVLKYSEITYFLCLSMIKILIKRFFF